MIDHGSGKIDVTGMGRKVLQDKYRKYVKGNTTIVVNISYDHGNKEVKQGKNITEKTRKNPKSSNII